jgi:TonB family protein
LPTERKHTDLKDTTHPTAYQEQSDIELVEGGEEKQYFLAKLDALAIETQKKQLSEDLHLAWKHCTSKATSNKQKKHLLNIIGNPCAEESQWMHACKLLGSEISRVCPKHQKRSNKRRLFAWLIAACSLISLVFVASKVHGPNPQHATPIASKPAESDVDFGPYMADMQRRIKGHWFPPKEDQPKRVVLLFKVHSNGAISDVKLEKPSGSKLADLAAIEAVRQASPLNPLPAGASPDVDLQFTFDYNVFQGSSEDWSSADGSGIK